MEYIIQHLASQLANWWMGHAVCTMCPYSRAHEYKFLLKTKIYGNSCCIGTAIVLHWVLLELTSCSYIHE